jgi:DNA-binding response OmpR family regulator
MRFFWLVLKHYDVIEATTAQEALHVFAHHDRKVDLLITDVRLPTLSGIQVALLFRLTLPHLPVLPMSDCPAGGWRGIDSADLERLGSESVVLLDKPFEVKALLNVISYLLGSALIETARTA